MGGYERMKIICMFDLPTDSDNEKREYRIFRKSLIENGFVMMQFSVYVRTCPNRTFANKFLPKIKNIAPRHGNVRLLTITEKQYNDMEMVVGKRGTEEFIMDNSRIIVI